VFIPNTWDTMSMDKWLEKENADSKPERVYTKEEIEGGKKKRILELVGKKSAENNPKKKPSEKEEPPSDFFTYILEFKTWLSQRTYIKGDLDKLEIWIKNLYNKLDIEGSEEGIKNNKKTNKKPLSEQFKRIPPKFIEEKMRLAISKKLRGTKGTSSDAYYIRKLKGIIQEKLKEAEYYEVLKKILE